MIIAHIDVKKIVIQILISVILLVGSGFLVYKNFVKKDKKDYYLIPVHKDKKVEEGAFEQVIRVLENENFKDLIKYGSWPIEVGEKGNTNPFLKL